MPATIRLKRVGRKKQAAFRIVVAERSTAVTGPSIENLGVYQPRTEPSLIRLNAERSLHWLRSGAKPSDTVRSIFQRTGLWEKYHEGVTPEELTEKEIRLGPPRGQEKTSGRARAAAEARKAAEAAEQEEPEASAGGEDAGDAEEADDADEEPEEGPEAEAGEGPEAEAGEEEEPGADAEDEDEEEEAEEEAEEEEEQDEAEDEEDEEDDGK
jgi:small subunit ribosomal protein S16